MPYVAWNKGRSWQWHDESEDYHLQAGEVDMGCDVPTEAALRAAFPDYDTWEPA